MTKLTFQNGNQIIVEGFPIGRFLPDRAPNLKVAAQLALDEIRRGNTPDCDVTGVVDNGDLQDISFQNGALLTVPADYTVTGYRQALEILLLEIRD